MEVKLWNKETLKYEIIYDIDSVFCSTIRDTIVLTSNHKKQTPYPIKLYDLVAVEK